MSNIPKTLEELQFAILQADLQDNPYLQPHSIPARDKELKTKAKKIIPAINELLKIIETCKTSIDTYSGQIETTVRAVVEELAVTLKQEYAKEVDQRFISLEGKVKQLVEQQIESHMGETGASIERGSAMKKKFISKATVNINGVKAPFKFTEIQNIQEQIVPIAKTDYAGGGYINIAQPFELTAKSVCEIYNTPLELRVNPETDEVMVINRGNTAMVVYFFEMV